MSAPSDADIIAKNPIGNGLERFRRHSRAKCKDLGISEVRHLAETSGATDLALELILALQSISLARVLPSRSGRGTLLRDLSNLVAQIDSGEFNVRSIVPLFEKVDSHASDLEICNALFALVARPTTPPQSGPSFTASFQQTPWSFNSASAVDTSDHRKDVDPILKAEVEDNLIIDHPEFFDTFFGEVTQLPEIATAVFEMCKDAEPSLYTENVGWTEWPDDCGESRVLNWLRRHIDQFLLFANRRGFRPSKRRRCITTPNNPIPGSVSKRKLDVSLAYDPSNERENSNRLHCNWSHILVPGELKSNPREDNHSSTWFDLLRYAREVFGAQDTRRYVLGFTLCGSKMRLWEFDRLGGVASGSFDVNRDGQMFVSAILGFLWMDEEELGFDSTVVEEGVKDIPKSSGMARWSVFAWKSS
ncbi:hypothetical protein H2199_005759 [Coniosporium tulheliwenetii]|uniref:Uncharacterized protein n=1 Tax=Coniosporium tulheliwenetii TaxID=3383036 RepID=A0ACC2Z0F2_9PEZI|nr:hypothetical protein H2199_005759 [Cladosporium sp. JES 115]